MTGKLHFSQSVLQFCTSTNCWQIEILVFFKPHTASKVRVPAFLHSYCIGLVERSLPFTLTETQVIVVCWLEAKGNKTSKAIKQILDALLVLKESGVGRGNPAPGPSTQDESGSSKALEAKKGGGRRSRQNPRRRRKNKAKNNFAATIRVAPDGTISLQQKPVWGKGSSRQHPYPKGGKGGKKSPQKEPPKPNAPNE
ncbi:hypothetical protein GE061_008252 [Apolygus lucorum]|uniref:Uncharacterized protein n=1 Tax=Apolygus lucorum TaxID=248454 RepID=A0A6A4J4N8_APOLU|nr:hypothetical protein GE061_008252 [Apolygus lucorum]